MAKLEVQPAVAVSIVILSLSVFGWWAYAYYKNKLALDGVYKVGVYEPLAIPSYPSMTMHQVFYIRIAFLLWVTFMWLWAPISWGSPTFSYFTIWNFTVIFVYFVNITAFTYIALYRKGGVPDTKYYNIWRGVLWITVQNEWALAMLVDATIWFFLFWASDAENKRRLLTFPNWTYHFANAIFMGVDFWITSAPVSFHWGVVCVTAGMTYGWFSWIYYAWRGRFRYFFLDPSVNIHAIFYFLVFGLHFGCWVVAYKIAMLKSRRDRLDATKARFTMIQQSAKDQHTIAVHPKPERVLTAMDTLDVEAADLEAPTPISSDKDSNLEMPITPAPMSDDGNSEKSGGSGGTMDDN